MKFSVFAASALGLAASASAMIIEPTQNLEARFGSPDCGEWNTAYTAVQPTDTLKSGNCPQFMDECGKAGGNGTLTKCKDSKRHPGMVAARCLGGNEVSPIGLTWIALVKSGVTSNWKGEKIEPHLLRICSKSFKFDHFG